MQLVPLSAVPSQQLQISLAGQSVGIRVYSLGSEGLIYVDTHLNGQAISYAVLAQDVTVLVPTASYRGFLGNLLFTDTMGTSSPQYTGLGSRWVLIYLTAAEYAAMVAATPYGQ